jgi:REP element-mobilizing transposase RayT
MESGEAFVASASVGPTYLRRPEIAELVVDAIRYGETEMRHYELHAYVVMCNHVHLLITPLFQPAKLTQPLKGSTARHANKILGLTGQTFWQEESYDRLVRDDCESNNVLRYIELNPVRAGLINGPGDFAWSSFWPTKSRPAG